MKDLEQRLEALGITSAHCQACNLPLQQEARHLVDAGQDVFGRPQKMTEQTYFAWQSMQNNAANDSIVLQLVSAYRSIDYQCQLISKKLARGDSIDSILKVNAIPGYSEHHTGRALDLTTPGCKALEESFDTTAAFTWLLSHAERFGFHLSYPKNNPSAIDYEPWHWAFVES